MNIYSRFLSKTAVSNSGDCWIWKSAKNQDGYGSFSYKGENARAHRVSYLLFIGEIPEGKSVCHKCDNPPCVNPSHLFLGTQLVNIFDRNTKGRTSRKPRNTGPKNPSAILDERKVIEIREKYAAGRGLRDLDREYGVKYGTCWAVVHRQTWKYLS